MQTTNDERIPFWFSKDQIDLLARTVGDHQNHSNAHILKGINDDIGVASARMTLSPILTKLSRVFQKTPYLLKLSPEECNVILLMNPSPDIVRIITDGT